jgi:hypothetical protein
VCTDDPLLAISNSSEYDATKSMRQLYQLVIEGGMMCDVWAED